MNRLLVQGASRFVGTATRSTIIFSLLLLAAVHCSAQLPPVAIGTIDASGNVAVTIDKGDVFDAIVIAKQVQPEEYPLWIVLSASNGTTPYLICEVNDFVIGFECYRDGNTVFIKQDGITHIGTSEKCYNCVFSWTDSGEINGCSCDDKGYEGPERTCNHSIRSPQEDVITTILLKRQFKNK
ncbi:MAG: hypothetical protein WBQ23_07170 [Bacteroidota bacterium]